MTFRHSAIPIAALIALLVAPAVWARPDPVWVMVDTRAATVSVMRGDQSLFVFEDISIGRGGTSDVHIRGDDTTPLGEFEIVRVNGDSRYRRFYGINYPTPGHAQMALERGAIDKATYNEIGNAFRRNVPPPQYTPLGGHLGIHGLGGASLEVHQSFNWTNGCIALTNPQIDRLSAWIRVGTRVVVR